MRPPPPRPAPHLILPGGSIVLLCGVWAFKTPTKATVTDSDLDEEIAVEASGAAHLDQLPEGAAVDR